MANPKTLVAQFPRSNASGSSKSQVDEQRLAGNAAVDDLESFRRVLQFHTRDQVEFAATGPGLSVDTNAADVETDNAVIIRNQGGLFALAANAAIDISVLIGAASTINTSKAGALWVYGSRDGSTMDVETDIRTADWASEIQALAQYSIPTVTLPPAASLTPVGVVTVVEGGSGAFTWGTDSITAETETYYSFNGAPCILSPAASFAADAAAATFTYGATVLRLGTGVIVSASGKTGVTIAGSTVATGKTGAWLVYVLADDVEIAVQVGAAYSSIHAARAAVRALAKNPLLPEIGVIYVENDNVNGTVFTPGTSTFQMSGVTATFEIEPTPLARVDSGADITSYKVLLA